MKRLNTHEAHLGACSTTSIERWTLARPAPVCPAPAPDGSLSHLERCFASSTPSCLVRRREITHGQSLDRKGGLDNLSWPKTGQGAPPDPKGERGCCLADVSWRVPSCPTVVVVSGQRAASEHLHRIAALPAHLAEEEPPLGALFTGCPATFLVVRSRHHCTSYTRTHSHQTVQPNSRRCCKVPADKEGRTDRRRNCGVASTCSATAAQLYSTEPAPVSASGRRTRTDPAESSSVFREKKKKNKNK